MSKAVDWFLSFFRPKPLVVPEDARMPAELSPADYQNKREQMPLVPISGWGPEQIQQMLESHDQGNFQLSELFYHALRKEGLIASALDLRRQSVQIFTHTLQCPKDAPPEFHAFTEALAKDWQSVMPDDTRGIIIERANVFGFCVCRVQWTYKNGQRQPRLIPWTHSSLSWRQDLWCYQGQSETGTELIRADGREWVIFDLGEDRPYLRGLIRPLAFVLFGIITGDDRWLNFNDKFAEPKQVRIVPRLMRESIEAQRVYQKESAMRGGDMVMCPQDENGKGYDFRYEQVNAQGYNTLKDMLMRFDERAAIIILGHNLLQRVAGGSLAAMNGALDLFAIKAKADGKILQSGFVPMSEVWARANFGANPDDYPALCGQLPESKSWELVYDFTTPADKQAAGVRAAQFGQAFASFIKALVAKDGLLAAAPDQVKAVLLRLDLLEAARRCGIPLKSGDESYAQQDEEKVLESVVGRRAARALLQAHDLPASAAPMLLASGESPDSAAGLIEGQQQIDQMIDASAGSGAPALAVALAALAAAADWSDLRARLEGVVRDFDLRDAQSALREQLRTADTIGSMSVDHDLATAARAEVDAVDRRRTQPERLTVMQEQQQRASMLARAATAYALYAVARHLWDDASRAEAGGQPLELHRQVLAEALGSSWGPAGPMWDTARAEPLQHAFTGGRYLRLNSAPLRAILSYWTLDVVLDGRTTSLCRSLSGYTRPAGDSGFPVPPLHWKCRTTIRGLTRAEGEARVSSALPVNFEPGFGTLDSYPGPESGPAELLTAHRSRI